MERRRIQSSDGSSHQDETSTSQTHEHQSEISDERLKRQTRFLRSSSDTNLETLEQTGAYQTRLRRSRSDSHLSTSHLHPADASGQEQSSHQPHVRDSLPSTSGSTELHEPLEARSDSQHEKFEFTQEQKQPSSHEKRIQILNLFCMQEQQYKSSTHNEKIKQQIIAHEHNLRSIIARHHNQVDDLIKQQHHDQELHDQEKQKQLSDLRQKHDQEKPIFYQEIMQERLNLDYNHALEDLKLHHEQQNPPPDEQQNKLDSLQYLYEQIQQYIYESFHDKFAHQLRHQIRKNGNKIKLSDVIEHVHTFVQERAREEYQKHSAGQLLGIDLSGVSTRAWVDLTYDFLAKQAHKYGNHSSRYRYLKDILQSQLANYVSRDEGPSTPPVSDEERKSQAYQDLIPQLRDKLDNALKLQKNSEDAYQKWHDKCSNHDNKHDEQNYELLWKMLYHYPHDSSIQYMLIEKYKRLMDKYIENLQERLNTYASMNKYFQQKYSPHQEQTKLLLKQYKDAQEQCLPFQEQCRLFQERYDSASMDDHALIRMRQECHKLYQQEFNRIKQILDKNRDKLDIIGKQLDLDLSRVTWKMFSKASDAFLAEHAQMYGTANPSYKYLVDISQGTTATHVSHDEGSSTPPVSDDARKSQAYQDLIPLYRIGCIKYLVEDLLPGIGLSQVQTESCADLDEYIQDQSKKKYESESYLYKKAVDLSRGLTVNLVPNDGHTYIERLEPDFRYWKQEWHKKKEGKLLDINLSTVRPIILQHIHKQILDSYKDKHGTESPHYQYAVDISQGGVSNLVQDAERKNKTYHQVLTDFRHMMNKLLHDPYRKWREKMKIEFKQKNTKLKIEQLALELQYKERKRQIIDLLAQRVREQQKQGSERK
jgi:hypothetical protein